MRCIVNILLTINERFVRQAVVLISSVQRHNAGLLRVYIACETMSEESAELLKRFCGEREIELRLVKCSLSVLRKLRTAGPFPAEVYLRLLAHEFVDEERVLYLDADILCLGNLEELYALPLGDGCPIAACAKDRKYCRKEMLLSNWDLRTAERGGYFNSGVLLMDLNSLRKEGVTAEMWVRAAAELSPDYLFDQGLLNVRFARQALLLPSDRFNCRCGARLLQGAGLGEAEDIRLLHFAGEAAPYKPWDLFWEKNEEMERFSVSPVSIKNAPQFVINQTSNSLARLWWEEAEHTPVYCSLKAEMEIKKDWFERAVSGYLRRMTQAVMESVYAK